MRSCVGCGQRAPQRDLVRFVGTESGGLRLDEERRQPGRGAYLHDRDSCASAFVARKPPLRSLRRSVDRPRREALIARLQEGKR
jgi:predicted RNA-binding protein YlxR (DUF448 family)